MNLLIADDNANMRVVLRNICSQFFNVIYECSNGIDAVKLYKQYKPDWTLMDIRMERMDGISAIKEILRFDHSAKTIVVSQFNDPEFVESAKNAGAVEFVGKEDLTKIEDIIIKQKK